MEEEYEVPSPHEHALEEAAERASDGLAQRIALMTAILSTIGLHFFRLCLLIIAGTARAQGRRHHVLARFLHALLPERIHHRRSRRTATPSLTGPARRL